MRASLVQCKASAGPVAGGAQLLELADDVAAVLLLPVPDPLQKLLASQIVAGEMLVLPQMLLHLDLGGDSGVIGAGEPEGGVALHPFEAHDDVLEGLVQRVTHVEFSGDVGRRDYHREGGLAVVHLRGEVALLAPEVVQPIFNLCLGSSFMRVSSLK